MPKEPRSGFIAALYPAAIVLAACLAFGLTLRGGFMWDDHQMIEQNPALAFTRANVAHAFVSDPFNQGLNYYRPLQTLSNMADFAVWGYNPAGYHLTNLVCHAAAAALLFYLALALGFGLPASFMAALLLAVHPAVVEQLLIIAGRAELASTACMLASLLLFLKKRTALAFAFFLGAVGFKENGVITPALGALCLWHLGREKKEYKRLLPFLAFIPLYFFLRHQALGLGALSKGFLPTLAGLFLKAPQCLAVYLKEALLPFDMSSHRMQPVSALLNFTALPALAAAAVFLYRRGSRTALFCAGWYLLNLAPKLPLLATNDLMLDHWAYLANSGLFLWAAEKAAGLAGLRRLLPAAAAAVFMGASAFNITQRNTDLKNYERAARTSSSKPMLYNLAREYYFLGRPAESRALMERISAAEPGSVLYLNGLALARWRYGDSGGALLALENALALKPADPDALFNKYCVLAAAGRVAEAAAALDRALEYNPGYPPALLAMARGQEAAGRKTEAAVYYGRLLAASPYNLEGLNDYGVLLAKSGDYEGAERLFRTELKVSPGLPSARANLAHLAGLKAAAQPPKKI